MCVYAFPDLKARTLVCIRACFKVLGLTRAFLLLLVTKVALNILVNFHVNHYHTLFSGKVGSGAEFYTVYDPKEHLQRPRGQSLITSNAPTWLHWSVQWV